MESKLVMILLIFAITTVNTGRHTTYNATELLSGIFKFERNEFETDNSVTSPKRMNDIPEISKDISEDVSEDFPQNSVRNNIRKKRRRPRRYQNGYGYYPQHGHFYERPSFASEALSRVTEALTSIALYDDFQCVPRLLCEAGGDTLSTSLPSGLQPLLTLLSAYGGTSANPLFVFGRAVLLGMSSKGNAGTCRYAYSQCPTDPEQLIHYLNNHNGGFFRFFSAPQSGQQNLQQFYNQLQGQQPQQNYGHNQFVDQNLYGQVNGQYNGYQNSLDGGYGFQKPNPYVNLNTKYGSQYPYNFRSDSSGKIEKRIQNKPVANDNEVTGDNNLYSSNKWNFPEHNVDEGVQNEKNTRTLRFPESVTDIGNIYGGYNSLDNKRKTRGFSFPNGVDDFENYRPVTSNYIQDTVNNYKTQKGNNYKSQHDSYNNDGYVTVYVVRGNGDPNKPEVIKLRPGQSL